MAWLRVIRHTPLSGGKKYTFLRLDECEQEYEGDRWQEGRHGGGSSTLVYRHQVILPC